MFMQSHRRGARAETGDWWLDPNAVAWLCRSDSCAGLLAASAASSRFLSDRR